METRAAFAPAVVALRPRSSSLLAQTPPRVTQALSEAYPMLVVLDTVLGWITWTGPDPYQSFLLCVGWWLLVQNWSFLVLYFWQVMAAAAWAAGVVLSSPPAVQREPPSLDAIVGRLSSVSERWRVLVSPISSTKLRTRDIVRFLVTAIVTSPLYIVGSWAWLCPTSVCLWTGLIFLTWHSLWFRVFRSILWRWIVIRQVVFWLTGIDNTDSETVIASSQAVQDAKEAESGVQFTYVLYENQRRWLGIGWTTNMLAYERGPWTDELLNETPPPESFTLPDASGTGMAWRWADDTWLLDLTNDGSLVPQSRAKTSPDPADDDGFVYYDNTWTSPAAESTFSKYTRRRRWIRTAVLAPEKAHDPPKHRNQAPDQTSNQALDHDPDQMEPRYDSLEAETTLVSEVEGSTAVEKLVLRQRPHS